MQESKQKFTKVVSHVKNDRKVTKFISLLKVGVLIKARISMFYYQCRFSYVFSTKDVLLIGMGLKTG